MDEGIQRQSTQRELILLHLQNKSGITALDAINLYGCMRLAARICELRKADHNIKDRPFKTNGGATIKEYFLAPPVVPA